MTELTEKLMATYSKRNTPRLIRKAFNLERARLVETTKNDEMTIPKHRDDYYSHRLYVLETILKERGIDINAADMGFGEAVIYKYQKYKKRKPKYPELTFLYEYDKPNCLSAYINDFMEEIKK